MSAAVAWVQSAAPGTTGPAGVLRRKCDCEGSAHECEECKKKSLLQRQASGGGGPRFAPPLVHEVLRSPGEPLDHCTRAFMDARFGHDFGRVRVHADPPAAESARLVQASAYTVGHDIVLGAGQPSPSTVEGRALLAHELTHTLQQAGSGRTAAVPARLEVGPLDDTCEREADAVAARVVRGQPAPTAELGSAPVVQRTVDVTPGAAAGDILSHFNHLCPGQFTSSGSRIVPTRGSCTTSSDLSCECACATATDSARTYTIDVQPAAGSSAPQTLHDGTTAPVPDTSLYPSTAGGNNPTISMVASSGSSVEFGFFDPKGRPVWYENWRILAHELCGHGRLNQTYAGGRGCRAGHDTTIATENAIAAEHGGAGRGQFGDTRQGEAFWNPVGDRSKVAFYQCSGLHYEAP